MKQNKTIECLMFMLSVVCEFKKTAHILHHWFLHEMMSEKPVQKFHTNDMTSLPRSIWVMLLIGHAQGQPGFFGYTGAS